MEKMTPIEELMHEHQHILKVVNALKALGDRMEHWYNPKLKWQ